MKRTVAVLVMSLSVAASQGSRAGESGLKAALASIPSDAVAFVLIPSVETLDRDYQQTISAMGLEPLIPPAMKSIVGLLKQQVPALGGLDESGSLALVLMRADMLFGLLEKQALLIPTKDPQAMIASMEGQRWEEGLWSVKIAGQGGYAAISETHLIVAASAEVAKAIKDSKTGMDSRLKATELRALTGLDLALWIDADWLLKMLKPMIDGFLTPMMMHASGGAFSAMSAAMNKQQLDEFVEGVATVSLGVSLEPSGLGLRFAMTSKPGSELAKQTKIRTTTGSLLEGLPATEYMVALGETVGPAQRAASPKTLDSLFSILDDVEGIDAEQVQRFKALISELLPMISSIRAAVIPLAPGPDGLVGISVVMDVSDSKRWLELVGKKVDLGKQVLAGVGGKGSYGMLKELSTAITHKVDAEEINGVTVQHFKLDLARLKDVAEADLEKVMKVIGREGLLVRVAPVDSKTVVLRLGGGKGPMGVLIEQAKKREAPLARDAGIRKVASHLPKERAGVTYFAVDRIVTWVQNVMKVLEEEGPPFQMSAINAPVAVAVSGSDGLVQGDLFVPMELMIAVKNSAMALMAKTDSPDGASKSAPVQP